MKKKAQDQPRLSLLTELLDHIFELSFLRMIFNNQNFLILHRQSTLLLLLQSENYLDFNPNQDDWLYYYYSSKYVNHGP